MKRKVLMKIFSGILLIAIGFLSACMVGFGDQKEYKMIVNYKSNEKIYLIKTSWGLGDSRMAIGLDEKLNGGFANHYPEKYESRGSGDSPILYKLANDSLYIYDGIFIEPKINKFKTKIKLIPLDPVNRIELYKNYKKMGLNIFPENQTYIIENSSKD